MDFKEIRYSFDGAHKSDETVRYVQSELNFMRSGLMGAPWPGVTTDGVFTVQTRNAIMDFQKAVGLSPTGVIDEKLVRAMCDFGINKKPRLLKEQYDRQRWQMQLQRDAEEQARAQAQARAQSQVQTPAPSPVPKSSIMETYVYPPLDTFMLAFKNLWSGICADVVSIWLGARKDMSNKEFCVYLYSKIKTLLAKDISEFVAAIKKTYPILKQIPQGAKDLFVKVKDYGAKLIAALKSPSGRKKLAALFTKDKAREFVKGNKAGMIICGIPMVYYLLRCMFFHSTAADRDKNWVLFKESLSSFIGAVLVMAAVEVAAGVTVAIGASSLPVASVAAIIGIVVAIVDILIVCISGTGIGDWTMAGIDYIGNYVAEVSEEVAVKAGKKVSRTLEDLAWSWVNAMNPMNHLPF